MSKGTTDIVMKMKAECHRICEFIWGKDKNGRALCYAWLGKRGVHHFSEVNDYSKLFKIRKELQKKLIDEGLIDNLEDLNYL